MVPMGKILPIPRIKAKCRIHIIQRNNVGCSVQNPFVCLKIQGDASGKSYITQFSCPFLFILSTGMDSEYVTLLIVALTSPCHHFV